MRPVKDEFESDATRILSERIAAFRRSVDDALASLAAPVHLPPRATDGGGADFLGLVRALLDSAAHGGGQREILGALLAAAGACYPRTVLFILRGNALVRWGAGTAGADGQPSDVPGHLAIPSGGDHLLARALEAGALQPAGADGPGFVVTEALGGHLPGRAAAIPLNVRGRAVAVLYGDDAGGGGTVSEAGFEIIGRIGTLTLESLAAARRPRVTGAGAAIHGRVEAAHPAAVAPANVSSFETGLAVSDVEGRADHGDPGSGSATLALPASRSLQPGSPVPTPPEDAEMQALLGDIDVMPRRDSADDGQTHEERRLHQDARRFASLLVSELLLYNEEAVILGRKNQDLVRRLSREIEKSRKAYTARIPAHLKGAARYLDDEMVRVLAEGDPGLLKG